MSRSPPAKLWRRPTSSQSLRTLRYLQPTWTCWSKEWSRLRSRPKWTMTLRQMMKSWRLRSTAAKTTCSTPWSGSRNSPLPDRAVSASSTTTASSTEHATLNTSIAMASTQMNSPKLPRRDKNNFRSLPMPKSRWRRAGVGRTVSPATRRSTAGRRTLTITQTSMREKMKRAPSKKPMATCMKMSPRRIARTHFPFTLTKPPRTALNLGILVNPTKWWRTVDNEALTLLA